MIVEIDAAGSGMDEHEESERNWHLRIQNGGLTTQHDTEKRRESEFGPFFTGILTFKWIKVFFMIRDDPS